MSLFKITVRQTGGSYLAAPPVCKPSPKPVSYSTLENLGAGPTIEAAAQDGVDDILGDILSITATQAAAKQERERKAAGQALAPDTASSDLAERVEALPGISLPEVKALGIVGGISRTVIVLEKIADMVADAYSAITGKDRAYLDDLADRIWADKHGLVLFAFHPDTLDLRLYFGPEHILESIRASVLQGKKLAGMAKIEEEDELRIMIEELHSTPNNHRYFKFGPMTHYNTPGGHPGAESFFNALSGPKVADAREVSRIPEKSVKLKSLRAFDRPLNIRWRDTTTALPTAHSVDVDSSADQSMRKKFKYDE